MKPKYLYLFSFLAGFLQISLRALAVPTVWWFVYAAIAYFLLGITFRFFKNSMRVFEYSLTVLIPFFAFTPPIGSFMDINYTIYGLALTGLISGILIETLKIHRFSYLAYFIVAGSCIYYLSNDFFPNHYYNKRANTLIHVINKPLNFELTTLTGVKVTEQDFKNKIVLLDFWFVGCKPCREKFEEMLTLQKQLRNPQDVVIAVVTAGKIDEVAEVVKFRNKHPQYKFVYLYDTENALIERLKVKGYPTEVILNKKGIAVSTLESFEPKIYVEKTIANLNSLL